MFDEIPQLTYEKIGSDYIGSAIDNHGNIIFSDYLGYELWGNAFGGREISLQMKDGSIQKIKDNWFTLGTYKPHGDFIGIGGGTLETLQNCYCYFGYNINVEAFQRMLDDYYSREKEYEYDEIRKWTKLQYKWYDVIIDKKRYPLMVNECGDFVDRYSKEPVFVRNNYTRYHAKTGKSFGYCLFKWQYNDGDRLVKIEKKMLDVLKESLPHTEEEILKNCKLPISV
ncbi:MAG: hypothetical protein RR313_11290 [Anaerovoracaceae bacterium]